jgi:hypothetical protein
MDQGLVPRNVIQGWDTDGMGQRCRTSLSATCEGLRDAASWEEGVVEDKESEHHAAAKCNNSWSYLGNTKGSGAKSSAGVSASKVSKLALAWQVDCHTRQERPPCDLLAEFHNEIHINYRGALAQICGAGFSFGVFCWFRSACAYQPGNRCGIKTFY